MKFIKYSIFSFLALALFALVACEKVQSPLPEFESAITAEGKLVVGNFVINDVSKPVTYKWGWKSIDNKNTVSKVEFFVTFTEGYTDKDGNTRTANHGTKAWKVIDGAAAGPNHGAIDGSITQAEIYNLFQAATFDYGLGGGKTSVWSQRGRTTANRMITADRFAITWHITAADGRKFTEWSVGLCDGTTVGSNCAINFGVK